MHVPSRQPCVIISESSGCQVLCAGHRVDFSSLFGLRAKMHVPSRQPCVIISESSGCQVLSAARPP
jgi:hypothetical protein